MKDVSRKQEENLSETALTNELIHLLSHSRHDWMNKLQLIKGNLSLQKYDRVFEIIDEMVIDAKHESKLSNLKTPHLAFDFLTFNWKAQYMTLEYEVLGDIKDMSAYDVKLAKLMRKLFHIFDQAVSKESENHLTVSLQTDHPDKQLILYLDFHGAFANAGAFDEFRKAGYEDFDVMRFEMTNHECLVEIGMN
ncbi:MULTISPECIES: sporulation initiation phosphotransferase B [Bacillus]|uniref:sporulation initiation phosphotransferase B n=1 Tax=Bacillus TaxID=1386 RepID=UPI000D03C753|nr:MULTISPECIES: sporulation initiation phosphotransferase B [Bacillus]KAA6454616.1 sporulation protein [Bacillus atrophaeus]MCI3196331.1 sporulation protein [Bacillus sp. HU-1818]MCY8514292.1 sporulation initiation phosphotransferase B [Bacillus atrophaeus]MCY8991488.1 sporulation initiation phosphotransferase B [Bacillus atrophaeus]MCY9111034.1 sporulation initiation phosphotransferase B [Bacillus atrophaeus]